MCGIIGFLGKNNAVNEVIGGLSTLEYRGYDSAGIAFIDTNGINIIKQVGPVSALSKKVGETVSNKTAENSQVAIGHTRWATHGGVTERNSHPHYSNDMRVAVVHNGIIENFNELKDQLEQKGIVFYSNTDTEVIPNLIAGFLNDKTDLLSAVTQAAKVLRGSFAFLAIGRDSLAAVAAKHGNQPLIIGKSDDASFLSSDISAVLHRCNVVYALENDQFAKVTADNIEFFSATNAISKEPLKLKSTQIRKSKGRAASFMEKEIFEIPNVISRIEKKYNKIVKNKSFIQMLERIKNCKTVHIVACGTSYHAGLRLAALFETRCQKRAKAYIASEISQITPHIDDNDICIVISQSGETADTLSALQFFKSRGIYSVGICNVEGSSIYRYADYFLPTFAGTEVSVASTKVYCAQIFISEIVTKTIVGACFHEYAKTCITSAKNILSQSNEIQKIAIDHETAHEIFFLGKGLSAFTAVESALKVKEITYRHCEGLPAGELKHGTLSLVDDKTFTVAIGDGLENAVAEVSARGSAVWRIPNEPMNIIYGQLFALHLANRLKLDPDKPRNLAKSVTVE